MGSIHSRLKNYSRADALLDTALLFFKEINFNEGVLQTLFERYRNCIRSGDYQRALEYFSQYNKVNEAINDIDKSKNIDNLLIKYEVEKNEKEKILLEFRLESERQNNIILAQRNTLAQFQIQEIRNQQQLVNQYSRIQSDSILFLYERNQIQGQLVAQERALRISENMLYEKRVQNRNNSILFLFLLGISGFATSFMFNRSRKRKLQQNIKEVEEKALRAQLKPHFVFNALASIQKYVRENPALAESYLTKFAHFTQEVLVNSERKRIPLADEIAMLEKYIELHSLRLGKAIPFDFHPPSNLDPEEVMVPPAILQPLAENAINHNFAQKSGHPRLAMQCLLQGSLLTCTLEDFCEGEAKHIEIQQSRDPNRKSFGLQIVKERLELWSKGKKAKWSLDLIEQPGGMRVQMGIPQ